MTSIKQKLLRKIEKNWLSYLFFLSVFFLYLLSPADTDLGWHLRYGKQIFETGRVYRENQIGFYLANYQWIQSYSLYQLLIFVIYKILGLWGLALCNGIILGLIFHLTCHQKGWKLVGLSIFVFLGLATVTSLGIRSQLFTILGISFLLHQLTKNVKYSSSNLYILPIIFVFWVNLHGGFILGLVILTIYLLTALIEKNRSNCLYAGATILLSFLATLINPFGIKIYQESFRHIWYPLNKLIAEWVPPANQAVAFILITISAIVTIFIYQLVNKRLTNIKHLLFVFLTWLLFAFLAFTARRHLPLFTVSSVHILENILKFDNKKSPKKAEGFVTAIFLFAIIIFRLVNMPKLENGWQSLCQNGKTRFPCQAEMFLESNPSYCHNLFNTYEWGGHIAWQLPDRKTFIDGRMPAWPAEEGKSPYTVWLEIIQTQQGFEDRLEKLKVDCIFISKGTFLDLELRKNKLPWQVIYQDDFAVIWKKNE